MCDTSEVFGPTLRSHARMEESTADIDGIADGHSEGHADSDEHSEAADRQPMSRTSRAEPEFRLNKALAPISGNKKSDELFATQQSNQLRHHRQPECTWCEPCTLIGTV